MAFESEHTAFTTPADGAALFVDELRKGPIKHWRHEHEFREHPQGTLVRDTVDWSMPWLPEAVVRNQLQRMFDFRHRRLAMDLSAHAETSTSLVVAVTGASGMMGRALSAFLTTGGHTVLRLVRRPARALDEISWNPADGVIDSAGLARADAVVHLAGEPLFARWSRDKMRKIRDSRVRGTLLIARALAELKDRPAVLVSASAIGYYASSETPVAENGPHGNGFLAELVEDWERATDPAREAGIRVVHSRNGLVLSPRGGLLGVQLPAFRAGLGGWLGDGRQTLSWIAQDDVIYLLHHALTCAAVSGPLNVVGPNAVTGREFAKTLGRVLHRPAFIPAPQLGVRLVLGQVAAREFAGASQWVQPGQAVATGYSFQLPHLDTALRHMLGQ